MNTLTTLNKDMLVTILLYLPSKDLLNARRVCKSIEKIINDHLLREIILKNKNIASDLKAAYHRGSDSLLAFLINQNKIIDDKKIEASVSQIKQELQTLKKDNNNMLNFYDTRIQRQRVYIETSPDTFKISLRNIKEDKTRDISLFKAEKNNLKSSKALLKSIMQSNNPSEQNNYAISLLQKLKLIDNKSEKKVAKKKHKYRKNFGFINFKKS